MEPKERKIPMHFWTAHEFVLFCYLLFIECFSMVAGNSKFAQGLETYLLSRDHTNLKSEFQLGNGKVCLCSELVARVTIQRSLFWLKHLVLVLWSFLNTCFFPLQITVDCIENLPPVDLVLGEHLFLSVGDYFSRTQKSEWLDSHWTVFFIFSFFFSLYYAFLPRKKLRSPAGS